MLPSTLRTDGIEKTVEILPNEGADAECDKRSAEVKDLEAALDSLLRKARKDIKYVSTIHSQSSLMVAVLKQSSGILPRVEKIFTILKYL